MGKGQQMACDCRSRIAHVVIFPKDVTPTTPQAPENHICTGDNFKAPPYSR
jgi:hypothetical protein